MNRSNLLFAVGFVAAACIGPFASAHDCAISADEKAKLLALPYQNFDQSLRGGGWRAYAEKGCYALAANILDRYVHLHGSAMLKWQIRVVMWHAGQMYAFDNNYALAKNRFQNSYDPSESVDTSLLWNDYVSATLAFLDNDAEKLRVHRDKIANGPVWNGVKGNLDVVNGLLKCIGKPYAFAYSDPSCRK